jgi:engulfment/cell motility protein 1
VQRLSASDHQLCANALQLVNALMRDAVLYGDEQEWPKFVNKLQDLGVIGSVGMLMRGDAANYADSPLAIAVLDFQDLTKILLRKWRDVVVNVELPEHKRALKTIHLLSKPEPYLAPMGGDGGSKNRKHHPEKWRRLGFGTESPAWEFDETGYLGMMDLVDYTRRNDDTYQKILMEQSTMPREQRCPLARASLSVTLVLYELFEIDDSTMDGTPGYRHSFERDQSVDRLYKPLLLQWGRLHTASLNTFIRLWTDAGAEQQDIYKIEEVVRVVVERIIGTAGRKTDIAKVEDDLRLTSLSTARKWQMENLHDVYQDAWGPQLVEVHEQLRQESLQFMREQRIRCLLHGSWFPVSSAANDNPSWRYVKLSHNRRWLHHQEFPAQTEFLPALAELHEKIDLNNVTSVDSNVSAPEAAPKNDDKSSVTLTSSARGSAKTSTTKITILGTLTSEGRLAAAPEREHEVSLLELLPQTSSLASEWLDGLLMLLNQSPITKDTARLIAMIEDWGVRLRMLNLRWEDVDWEALERSVKGEEMEVIRPVPSREGIEDGDFWYALPDEQ